MKYPSKLSFHQYETGKFPHKNGLAIIKNNINTSPGLVFNLFSLL